MDFRCKIARENEILAEDVRSHPNPIARAREKKNYDQTNSPNESPHSIDLRACGTIANFSDHILIACSLDRRIDILRLKIKEKKKAIRPDR